jgi:hypothetical protein
MKKLLLVIALMTGSVALAHGPTLPPDPWVPVCVVPCFPWILCEVPCYPLV